MFAVGDDDQSIYAFRGAHVGNMADFEREYRVKQIIKLEQNYRSFGNILDAANALIAHNAQRLGKNLRTEAGPGEPVRVFEATSDFAEAQWLLEEAQALHRSGLPRSEIALLYRSNAQSRVLESALFNAGMPYRVYGGLRFFERAEVKHALAYLRLIENPNDDTSFLRVVNFPTRGIGARTIELLQDAARASGRSLYQSVGAVAGKGGANLLAFTALIDAMRDATRGLTLREIIDHVLQPAGLLDFYRTDKEGQDRIENLEELVNAAEAFVTQEGFGKDAVALPVDEQGGGPAPGAIAAGTPAAVAAVDLTPDAETGEIMSPLAAFLTHAALEAGDNQAQAGQDAIQLMTVHSAKGLEFDAVFITGIEEGLFPHENSLSDADGVEEERRLMYVAITRARKRLYLSFSQTRMLHGQTRYNVKSRFFDELPDDRAEVADTAQRRLRLGLCPRVPERLGARQRPGLDRRRGARRAGRAGLRRRADHVQHRQRHGPAHGAVGVPHQVRRRRDPHARRPRRRRARAGQLRPPRHQVAGAGDRQADAGRLTATAAVAAARRSG